MRETESKTKPDQEARREATLEGAGCALWVKGHLGTSQAQMAWRAASPSPCPTLVSRCDARLRHSAYHRQSLLAARFRHLSGPDRSIPLPHVLVYTQ
jgi:hypothetical protein